MANYLTFQALQDNCTISIMQSPVDGSRYEFLKQGATEWVQNQITLNANETCQVRGSNYPGVAVNNHAVFNITAPAKTIAGSAMSLVDGVGEALTVTQEYGFAYLFGNLNLKEVHAGLLPMTTLAEGCYSNLFTNSGLTGLPEGGLLPATTLAPLCYSTMFSSCASLTTVPDDLLPALELAASCYQYMFNSSGITEIPSGLLPATGLAEKCYYKMFSGCASLTEIPADLLPATTLAEKCYSQMFYNSKITKVPKGLLHTATPASGSYESMFMGCSSLNEVYVDFDSWVDNVTKTWLSGVSTTGDFYASSPNLQELHDTSHVPVGWNFHGPEVKVHGSIIFCGKVSGGIRA